MRPTLLAAVGGTVLAMLSAPAAALPSDSALNAREPTGGESTDPLGILGELGKWPPTPPSPPFPWPSFKPWKREQERITAEENVSSQLCPLSMSACPITASTPSSLSEWIEQGFECVEFSEDLTSCGGCGIIDAQYDCTAIPGALGVACDMGSCRVHTCRPGYSLAPDGMTCVSMH